MHALRSLARTPGFAAIAIVLAALPGRAATEDTNPLMQAQPQGAFVALSVSDAAAAAQWYADKLGFRVTRKIDPPDQAIHVVLLENSGALLELLEHPEAKPLKAYRPDAEGAYLVRGICKAGFIVKDIDRVLKELQERHVEIKHSLRDVPEFKMRSFVITDLEGNLIQFYGR